MFPTFYPVASRMPFVIEDHIEIVFDTCDGTSLIPLCQGTIERCIIQMVKHYVTHKSVLRYHTILDVADLIGDSIILFSKEVKHAGLVQNASFKQMISHKWNTWSHCNKGVVAHLWEPWGDVGKDILAEWLLNRIHVLNRINRVWRHLDKVLPPQILNTEKALHFTGASPVVVIAENAHHAWWTFQGESLSLTRFAQEISDDFTEMRRYQEGSREREVAGYKIIKHMRDLLPQNNPFI